MLAVLALAGCKQMPDARTVISPYKVDIQQGNVVTQEMISKLKAGMTRAQVRYVLGSPLVVDPFRTDRWDYVYTYQKQGKETLRRHITIIFDGDKLLHIEGDVVPADSAQEAQKPAVKPPVKATPAAKPAGAAAADKPVAAKPVAVQPEAAKADAKPAVKPAAAKSDRAKTAAKPEAAPPEAQKADTAKTDAPAAKTDEKKDPPKEKGFFGRMRDKLGF
ncbi:MAG: outer membrane protein assembly factor BamE [Xanthobacteraceae bacterium]|nr:outer membrane protein assembly factor BamE [Xanthobacteraceae bacterium]